MFNAVSRAGALPEGRWSLAIELLALLISRDEGITSIHTPLGREVKISLYADDVVVTVREEDGLGRVMRHLRTFEAGSGTRGLGSALKSPR